MKRSALAVAILLILSACTTAGSDEAAELTDSQPAAPTTSVAVTETDNAPSSQAEAPPTTPATSPAPTESTPDAVGTPSGATDTADAANEAEPVLSPTAAKNQVVITSPTPLPVGYLATTQVVTFIAQTNGVVNVNWIVEGQLQGTTLGDGVTSIDITFELAAGEAFRTFSVVAEPDNNGWLSQSTQVLLTVPS